jgi:hypothetical protein
MLITAASPNRRFLLRLLGALALRRAAYEDVESDRGAVGQALAVVVLSSAAAGVGAQGFGTASIGGVLLFTVVALIAWVAWAFLVYQIGTRVLPGARTRVDVGELLRTTGFSTAPGLLRVLGVVPGLTAPIFAIAALWMLVAMIVAVRQALDYTSTWRAVAACLCAWLLVAAFAAAIGIFLGAPVF